jgi:hypothetical protein
MAQMQRILCARNCVDSMNNPRVEVASPARGHFPVNYYSECTDSATDEKSGAEHHEFIRFESKVRIFVSFMIASLESLS